MKIFFTLVFLILSTTQSFSSSKPLTIIASINPIYQISKFIAGDKNEIILLVSPNISEHNYMPKPSDVRNINNADLVFYVSNDLEYYLPKILKSTNNKAGAVELINSDGLKLLKIKNNKIGDNYKIDPHIWLNPENAIIIAGEITKRLSALNPANSSLYNDNLKKFINEVNQNDKKIKANFSKIKKNNYLIYHNCYQYFEDYYQLNSPKIISHFQNSQLTIGDIKKINDIIKKDHLQCLIVQPQEESSAALGIADSNKIRFVIADIIGQKNYDQQNGYLELINNLVLKFSDCIGIMP